MHLAFYTKVCFLLILFLALNSIAPAFAEGKHIDKKAEYIFKFAQYVRWPKNIKTLTFCVVGQASLAIQLAKRTKGKKLLGRPLKFKKGQSPSCNILFVNQTNVSAKKNVLTISDNKKCSAKGAIFSFFLEKNKVRFRYSRIAAKNAKLKIAAQLLKLANSC